MNERIKLLAEQALQLVADEHTNGDESRLNTDSYHVKDLIQEKFAELIVRECMGVNSTLLGHNTCKNLHNLYEEHFGVEE